MGLNKKKTGAISRDSIDNSFTYEINGRLFVVEPVYSDNSDKTIYDLLISLLKKDNEKQ